MPHTYIHAIGVRFCPGYLGAGFLTPGPPPSLGLALTKQLYYAHVYVYVRICHVRRAHFVYKLSSVIEARLIRR